MSRGREQTRVAGTRGGAAPDILGRFNISQSRRNVYKLHRVANYKLLLHLPASGVKSDWQWDSGDLSCLDPGTGH